MKNTRSKQKSPIDEKLNELKKLSDQHLEKCMELLNAGNAKMYSMDLLSIAVFKRSMSLISGFRLMIRNKNFTCAAPIIRMQLDNALRFYATTLVKNPNELVAGFIKGTHINNFKDHSNGEKLTDSYLLKLLKRNFPGIEKVYKDTSGYIHLSEKHLFNTITTKSSRERGLTITVGADDFVVTDLDRIEATEAMIDISKIVLWCLSGWTAHKEGLK